MMKVVYYIPELKKVHLYLYTFKVNKIITVDKGRSPSNGKLSDFSFYIDS